MGKSTAIRKLAKKLDIGFIDVRLTQREPVDMRGLPVPDGEQVRWLVSSEWPRDPESKGIIIFDELTAADKTLQVAAYEFILDRRLGDLYKVPKNWYIVAAGNRTEDRAVACSMSSALANRFLHVEVAPQLRDFITYGESHGMHPGVLDFLRFRPKLLFSQKQENLQRGWPSPRNPERWSGRTSTSRTVVFKYTDGMKPGDLIEVPIDRAGRVTLFGPGLVGADEEL